MQKKEAFDVIAMFSERIISPEDFEYDEVAQVMQKTAETLQKYPDLSKYITESFILGLQNYQKDFSLEYTLIFSKIMRTKNTDEQKNYLQQLQNINPNLLADLENAALKQNPELCDVIFNRRLLCYYENTDPNSAPQIINVLEFAPNTETCEQMLKQIFDKKIPQIYRNRNMLFMSQIYQKFPEATDCAFEIIINDTDNKHYFQALSEIALFDEYKAEMALSYMNSRVQNGPIDEILLQKYYIELKKISDTLPKFKSLTQQYCREALLSNKNTEKTKKIAARLLEDEEALSSKISIGKQVKKDKFSPFGYKKVSRIDDDEICVLFLGGNGAQDDKIVHGYIKPVVELLKEHRLADKVNVYGITYDFGEYFKIFQALESQMKNYGHKPLHLPEFLDDMHKDTKNPQFIAQLFDKFILPRISRLDGKIKISAAKAAENMNKLKIIAHCFGGYAALELEKMSLQKMKTLGYSPEEANMIQGQMQIIAMNPYCPLGVQKSDMFSVVSAQDLEVTHNNFFEKYVRHLVNKGKNIPLCFFEKNFGNFLLVNRMYGSDNRRNVEVDRDEHAYYRFKILPAQSEKGKVAIRFLQNALINGLNSAISGKIRKQNVRELLTTNETEQQTFDKALKNGKIFYQNLVDYTLCENNKKFMHEQAKKQAK